MMPENSFPTVPPTPEAHFRLYFYAAVLHLIDHLPLVFETQEAAFERFPFLMGYVNELALSGVDGLSTDAARLWWRDQLQAWEASAAAFLPIRALAEAAGLDYDALVMLFAIGLCEEDPRFDVVFEALQADQHRLSYGTISALWAGSDARASLHHLLAQHLIQVANPDAPRIDWSLQVTPLLWDALSGRGVEASHDWLAYQPPDAALPLEDLIVPAALRTQIMTLPALLASGDVTTVIARGAQHSGRKTIVGALARALGRGTLTVAEVKPDDARWQGVGALATLLNAVPVLTFQPAPGESVRLPKLATCAGVVMGRHGGLTGVANALTLTVDMPTPDERRQHWRSACAEIDGLDEIAARFRLASGQIRRAAGLARTYARLAGRDVIAPADVQDASRALHRQHLDTLASPLPLFGDWSSLAVNGDTLRELRLLESRCRYRERLPDSVSATLGAQMTPGVRALFTGASGTGKTLAARILASVLAMDLYRVDLSSVVNKYIGETEKNLNELFSRAEELDVLLLIDEGDALLTQRTNVHNANDRYANLETNFLLQRLESYTGIVIITTNALDRIDTAFQRRMDTFIEFRAPEAAERWTIWGLHLPADHRVETALLREIASRCALTGGQIRNIVLHASVLALDDDSLMTSAHLEAAVQREYRRIGAVCPLRFQTNGFVKRMERT